MPTGPSVHYVAGSSHRPVPMATDLTTPRASHQQRPPKPRGLDWSQLTPRCKGCGEQSSRLNRDDRCPSCADPGTANVPTKAETKAKPATCTECQRDSRFLQDGLCPLCRAETTPIVLYDEPKLPQEGNQGKPTTRSSAPGATSTSSTTGRAPEAGPSTTEKQDPPAAQETRPAAAGGPPPGPAAWPSLPERLWSILVATEDCSGDPIAAMMRRSAIAALEALWLHWRLHHQTTSATPSPEGDLAGRKPAAPSRKGKATTGGRRPTTNDSDVDVERLIELYQAGNSAPHVAQTLGSITAKRVRAILERNHIQLRDDRGGRPRLGARAHIDDTTVAAMARVCPDCGTPVISALRMPAADGHRLFDASEVRDDRRAFAWVIVSGNAWLRTALIDRYVYRQRLTENQARDLADEYPHHLLHVHESEDD